MQLFRSLSKGLRDFWKEGKEEILSGGIFFTAEQLINRSKDEVRNRVQAHREALRNFSVLSEVHLPPKKRQLVTDAIATLESSQEIPADEAELCLGLAFAEFYREHGGGKSEKRKRKEFSNRGNVKAEVEEPFLVRDHIPAYQEWINGFTSSDDLASSIARMHKVAKGGPFTRTIKTIRESKWWALVPWVAAVAVVVIVLLALFVPTGLASAALAAGAGKVLLSFAIGAITLVVLRGVQLAWHVIVLDGKEAERKQRQMTTLNMLLFLAGIAAVGNDYSAVGAMCFAVSVWLLTKGLDEYVKVHRVAFWVMVFIVVWFRGTDAMTGLQESWVGKRAAVALEKSTDFAAETLWIWRYRDDEKGTNPSAKNRGGEWCWQDQQRCLKVRDVDETLDRISFTVHNPNFDVLVMSAQRSPGVYPGQILLEGTWSQADKSGQWSAKSTSPGNYFGIATGEDTVEFTLTLQ